ncbi:MAG TPA: DUF1559 domain-containing protein [Phycisphaerales bacterium]|nr:DUF1559 domain-containing protein [Phycisphaerales bacterium]
MQTRGNILNRSSPQRTRGGFTLLDVLVSIAVIALLIAMLLPSLQKTSEAARRVVCQSNIRQLGIGVLTYSDDYQGYLPPSAYLGSDIAQKMPQQMITARLDSNLQDQLGTEKAWDGLGILYAADYTTSPQVFYCPSHRGLNAFRDYANRWNGEEGQIVINFHYRGEGPVGVSRTGSQPAGTTNLLAAIDPKQTSLIADGMRVRTDFNHEVGANFFRADLSVLWFSDPGRRLLAALPTDLNNASAMTVTNAWAWYDRTSSIPAADPTID